MKPSLHPQEEARLRELHRYGILDTERERDFDELVEIASAICEAPVSVVNFIDEGRQWFKAEVGLGCAPPRSTPACAAMSSSKAISSRSPIRCRTNAWRTTPLCMGDEGFRFYAGAVLRAANGLPIGTLCVLDYKPRTLTEHQRRVLTVLSKHVMRELNLRLALAQEQTLRREVDHRVKNSLASIGALLSMKARRAADEAVQHALEDASIRVRSLSSLHAELHELEKERTGRPAFAVRSDRKRSAAGCCPMTCH